MSPANKGANLQYHHVACESSAPSEVATSKWAWCVHQQLQISGAAAGWQQAALWPAPHSQTTSETEVGNALHKSKGCLHRQNTLVNFEFQKGDEQGPARTISSPSGKVMTLETTIVCIFICT
jgi:hypothetical protein